MTLRWRRRLTILALSSLATALLCELGVVAYTRATNTGRGVVYDADLGWRHLPNVTKSGEFWGRSEPATTNAHGWRDDETSFEKPPGVRRVVCVGDSFTFGVAVDYGERFTEFLEDELEDVEAINLGANAFGTDQELLVLEREGFRYDPDVVVLTAFLGNDLADILYDRKNHWPKPHFTLATGELELVPPVKTWDVTLRTSSYLGEGLFRFVRDRLVSRHIADDAPDEVGAADLFAALIARAAAAITAREADFVVVLVYSRPKDWAIAAEPPKKERAARDLVLASGASVLDTWELFREPSLAGVELYAPDGHWNAAGHELVARTLAKRLP
jgi:hypothetical protein